MSSLPPRHVSDEHFGWLLRPPTPDVSEYSESDVLTEYIWRNYTALLTAAEARAGFYTEPLDREAAVRLKGVAFAAHLDTTHGSVTLAELQAELRDGRAALYRRARDRVLSEHGGKVIINRCPACQRIVRSPRARQCLWCKHGWHHAGETTE